MTSRPTGEDRRRHPLQEEVRALLQHAMEIKRQVTAIFTGLWGSEMRALRWPDLDWLGAIGKPTNQHGYRDIPMTPLLVNTLKEWRLTRPRHHGDGLDFVFPNRKNGVLSQMGLRHSFGHARLAAGSSISLVNYLSRNTDCLRLGISLRPGGPSRALAPSECKRCWATAR